MPKQRISLSMIKDVIRLKWHANLSHEQIATTLKVSKGVVAKYVSLATVAGLDWETVQHWNELQLSNVLLPRAATSQPFVEPDWGRIHQELDRKGMTLMALVAGVRGRPPRGAHLALHAVLRALQGVRPHAQALDAGSTGALARSCSSTLPVPLCPSPTAPAPRCSSRTWPPPAMSSPVPPRRSAWTTGSTAWCVRCTSTAVCRS